MTSAMRAWVVPLAIGSLALEEHSGLRRATQTGERQLVAVVLEDLVAVAHPPIVTGAFVMVSGHRYQPGIGCELVCSLEGTQVARHH